nr:response regulator [Rhizobium sp. ACO-34A]
MGFIAPLLFRLPSEAKQGVELMNEILRDRLVLVVEDEYYLAMEIDRDLQDAGATVMGPVASVHATLDAIARSPVIDTAVLDMNLNGESIIPVADALILKGVPLVFATGYVTDDLPTRLSRVPRLEKPLEPHSLQLALEKLFFVNSGPLWRIAPVAGLPGLADH